MKRILQQYLKRLTNLSGNNRSILLLRLISDQFLDIHDLNFVENKSSFSIIADLMGRRNKTLLCAQADSRNARGNTLSMQLKRIDRIDRYIFEERGARDLYVGWPFVRGKLSDGTLIRCPLLFFPVTLSQESNQWWLSLRQDVNITFNKSFLLAYSHYNQISLEEDFVEHTFDDYETDTTVFRTKLYQLIKDSPVAVNFNQENFLDELRSFENYKKADFDEQEKEGELKLYPEAVLGIFPQAGSYLVPDYMHLIETAQYTDIEEFFADRSRQEDVDDEGNSPDYHYFLNKVKEEETFTPFKLDAYQENALKAIKRGNSMVVLGPPGTGKSQLICNLISDFVARGKQVLLVCQKRAALDVVYQRLQEKQLAYFVGLVHDFKNDRKAIYDQINTQIEKLQEFRQRNNSLDAIQLERRFLHACRKVDQITEEFEEFRAALFDDSEAGISVKELYLTSDRDKPAINLRQEYKFFTADVLEGFEEKLRYYFLYHRQFDAEDYPWRNRKRFVGYGIAELQHMRTYLEEIPAFQQKLNKRIEKLLGYGMGVKVAEKIHEGREELSAMLGYLTEERSYRYFRYIINAKEHITAESFPDQLWLSTLAKTTIGCFDEPGPEMSLPAEELGAFQHILKQRMDAYKNPLKYLRWQLLSTDKAIVRRVMASNRLSPSKEAYAMLERKIDLRLNMEHNLSKVRSARWLTDFPEEGTREEVEIWFSHQRNAVLAFGIFEQFRNFREYFSSQNDSLELFREKIEQLLELVSVIPEHMLRWQKYFREARIDAILSDPELSQKLMTTLHSDFDALCDFDQLKSTLEEYERAVIDKVLDYKENSDEESVLRLFQNSIRLAWIDHIETKYPILRAVNSLKFEHMQKELQESVKDKLKVSNDIALMKVRERTFRDVEFNRLNNMVTYRDLQHQVTKKKQIWPLRKLITHFSEELFNLVPCWMASPEAVSALFPMEAMFDLVVFDEASQCFAERGIPAMYRGRQIVVTGDDKQLSPFDLYKVRWDEEAADDEVALEVSSLLDLASMYLMKSQLRGHYRSRSLDLIDFSNQYFYNGKLRLLPDRHIINEGEPSIRYIKVEGVWENNTNTTEAAKATELVLQCLTENPGQEIGVVTFNIKQQDLIMDMLESRSAEEGVKLPDTLFVKNIENVQGDEKDIIIFSIGYAPDNRGKIVHQFGSLNAKGGENRLNVAVTRAREKVYVVSSILPQQLSVDDTRNEGPKLLKRYLEYALDVSEGKFVPTLPASEAHGADWYLKKKLPQMSWDEEMDFQLVEEMPFADLTVKKDGTYVGLILTDDDLYHDAISIKDMHIYTPFALDGKNWRFSGIFSREYWHDAKVVKDRIQRLIKLS